MTTKTLLDREAFDAALAALPEELPLALAHTDIDEFAPLNDTLGHDAGDAVLRSFERTLLGSVPADALVGRISGDGYAVALPSTSAETALIVLEEIRAHFAAHEPAPEVPTHVHVSVGVAARPQHAGSYPELIRAADDALFRAKQEGRNRVAIYVEDKMTLKSSYYPRASLDQLSKLSARTSRTEASLLREALDDLVAKYRAEL